MSEERIIKINDEAGIELELATPEFVYMKIPAQYVCVYHKLLVMLADFGIDMLNDCSATCKGNNKNVITLTYFLVFVKQFLHEFTKFREKNFFNFLC